MKLGNIIKIKGAFGFQMNPVLQITEMDGYLVTLVSYPIRTGGLLESTNTTRTSVDMIKDRFEYVK